MLTGAVCPVSRASPSVFHGCFIVNEFSTRSTFSGKESTESGKTVNLFRCHSQRFNVYSLIILNIISATKGVSTTLKAQKIRNDFQLKLLSSATIR